MTHSESRCLLAPLAGKLALAACGKKAPRVRPRTYESAPSGCSTARPEGADAPLEPSIRSVAYGPVNQLRDPAIFVEDGRTYLLYAVAGETGIAIAELHFDDAAD